MMLRALTVRNLAGLVPGATLRFGDGVNVIHGPNEAGKSTLVRALAAALFQRHGVRGLAAELALEAAGREIAPEVTVEFTAQGVEYRLHKRFLRKPSATLERREGALWAALADDEAADEAVSLLMGASFAERGWSHHDRRGVAQILIAEQGAVVLEELGGDARDGLRAAVGSVSQTGEAKGLAGRVSKRHQAWFTEGGKVRTGAAASPVAQLEEEVSTWEARKAKAQEGAIACEDHQRVLQSAGRQRAERLRLVDEEGQRLKELRQTAQRAQGLDVVVARLVGEERDALRVMEVTRHQVEQLADQRGRLERGVKDAEQAAEALRRDEVLARDASEVLDRAHADERALVDEREQVRRTEQLAKDARRLIDLERTIEDRKGRLDADLKLAVQAKQLDADLAAAARPKKEEMSALHRSHTKVLDLQRQLDAASLHIRIRAERDLVVRDAAGTRTITAGAVHELVGADPVAFTLEGIASFEVGGPTPAEDRSAVERKLVVAQTKFTELARPFATSDLGALEALAARREEIERNAEVVASRREGIFTDEAARRDAPQQQTRERGELDEILARRPEWRTGSAPGEAELQAMSDEALRRGEELRGKDARVKGRREAAAKTDQDARTTLEAARKGEAEKRNERDRAAERVKELSADGVDDAARAMSATAAGEHARQLTAKLEGLREERALLGEDPERLVQLCDQRLHTLRDQDHEAVKKEERHRALLEHLLESGPYVELARAEEQLGVLDGRLDDARLELKALQQLQRCFEEERAKAVDVVLAPVRTKVERMARGLLGAQLGVQLGENFLPAAHPIAGTKASLMPTQLSYGTRDQFALLVRIAYAEVLARPPDQRPGERQLLVLDDPLVHMDAGRRLALLDVLERSAKDLQVLVLTCHPEHYAGLGEATVRIAMDDAVLAAQSP